MLAIDILNHNLPQLGLKDSVGKAKQLINDFKLTHLPVVNGQKFLGLISEDELLDLEEDKIKMEAIKELLIDAYVFEDVHYRDAVNMIISQIGRAHV